MFQQGMLCEFASWLIGGVDSFSSHIPRFSRSVGAPAFERSLGILLCDITLCLFLIIDTRA